jgi:HrpA-like RNA helicase
MSFSISSDVAVVGGKAGSGGGGGGSGGDSSNKPNSTSSSPGPLGTFRLTLPIASYRKDLCDAVTSSRACIVAGETGSGKTTQLPAFLLEEGVVDAVAKAEGKKVGSLGILITQPRRVAAVTVARRMSAEANEARGPAGAACIGHRVRFDDATTWRTRIVVATDGVLLREASSDGTLSAYGIIILDEAHERSLATDVLFGVVLRAMKLRPQLRVVVMSATLDTDLFRSFFSNFLNGDIPSHIAVPGRSFPVTLYHAPMPVENYVEAALTAVLQIAEEAGEEKGDILVFLTGVEDIDDLSTLIRKHSYKDGGGGGGEEEEGDENDGQEELTATTATTASSSHPFSTSATGVSPTPLSSILRLRVCPLFASLSPESQLAAFAPAPRGIRKVILSTNVAETSVTIPGIRFVIDSGKRKVRTYEREGGGASLEVVDISRAAAAQRAGRAGRDAPGQAYRLYTQDDFDKMAANDEPEVLREFFFF